ncbi:MAG: hypothetical protein AVDCRST_MAG77-6176 [uncultured Chloroflexi bacterium]|uniref:Uncharacterized protein n=1 Tax=uncultured Chloroflexota bacterium TaxID=166587 RepID=A0A6J4KK22_9CHLR|nr:MAG: hypothetical protein AVDCRST_MAG77-6176 [uncultured Chloroflexota bacterium]
MDEGLVGNERPETATADLVTAPVQPAQQVEPVSRHEIEPTIYYAIVPGPTRDTFLFYHMDASSKDVNGLWDYARFCISNLVWVNDHFVVTPNPLYLNPVSEMEERFAKIKRVLLNWYSAKRMVVTLELSAN